MENEKYNFWNYDLFRVSLYRCKYFIISAVIMVFVKPLIYIKFILFFLEKTTLNFFLTFLYHYRK